MEAEAPADDTTLFLFAGGGGECGDECGGEGYRDVDIDISLSLGDEFELCCDMPAALGIGLSFSGGGATNSASLDAQRSPAHATESADGEEEDGQEWRCLSAKHEPSCKRCSRPPTLLLAAGWVLRGDSPKSGEKNLRTLLTKTAEWSGAASRQRAAAAVLCMQPQLASALQRKDISSLRKAHFFALCSLWRYKSDVWVARAQAQRRGVRSAGDTPQPQPLLQRLPGCTENAVAASLACQLSLYVRATDDSRVHAAALREPLAPVLSWNAGLFDAFIPAIRNFVASTSEDALQLGARCCAHRESADAWWLSDARELLMRADAHLMLLQTAVGVYGQGMGALRAGGDGVSAVDRAALVTWQDALAVLNRFVSMSQSALALARIDHKADQYQLVTSKVVTSLSMLMRHMLSVFEGRRDWCLARGQRTARGLAGAGDSFQPLLMAGTQDVIVPMARAVQHSEIANSLEEGMAAVRL